ncbi:MAG: YdcH family protein [Hyphomicrobiaceae bacterium]
MTQRPDEREVRERLALLRAEHRQLDERIVQLEAEQSSDQVTIKRLKKQKLLLKDRITALEDQITPDIIA